MARTNLKYNFSDGIPVTITISEELRERILTLCNITELTQTAICRYLLKRGVSDMEAKLITLVDRDVAGEQFRTTEAG